MEGIGAHGSSCAGEKAAEGACTKVLCGGQEEDGKLVLPCDFGRLHEHGSFVPSGATSLVNLLVEWEFVLLDQIFSEPFHAVVLVVGHVEAFLENKAGEFANLPRHSARGLPERTGSSMRQYL